MPFIKLQFRQGLNRDQTNYTGEGGWWDGDKIRFFSGFPQKIGGWVKAAQSAFFGVCRELFVWITTFSDTFTAVGTSSKVYILSGGEYYDITPVRVVLTTPATDNCISTDNGSNVITVTVTAHGCVTGDFVIISGVTGNVGGVPNAEINAEHEIVVTSANEFTFTVTTAATSTASGGGTAIDITCLINVGSRATEYGYGWGVGAWSGSYGWGTSAPSPLYIPQRDWWFDNYDNDLVMNIRAQVFSINSQIGGSIYYWERGALSVPSTALQTRAVLLSSLPGASDVPILAGQVLVSQNDKHLLAFGAVPYGSSSESDYDPLLIRWASQNQPEFWDELDPASSAGSIRVSRGAKIVRAMPTRQETLVWTNTTLYSFQFVPDLDVVFTLQQLADNISIMAPRAVATANNVTYWMGVDKFYQYNGRVDTLPTTVREYVFKNFNFQQSDQVVAGTNEGFNEIWWFYPSATSSWNNRYVIYNYLENCWYFGSMVRTAWLDSGLLPNPLAAKTGANDPTGYTYLHETGLDDGDPLTDESATPIVSYIQSNDFDIGDGENYMLTRRVVPDLNFNTSTADEPSVTFTMEARNYPGAAYMTTAFDSKVVQANTATVNQYTNQVFIRARARQLALRVGSSGFGVQWQLGSPRLDARADGKQ